MKLKQRHIIAQLTKYVSDINPRQMGYCANEFSFDTKI